jgi:hypothetical protein
MATALVTRATLEVPVEDGRQLERQTVWFADDLQKTRTMKDAAWGEPLPNFLLRGSRSALLQKRGAARAAPTN